MLYNMPAVMDAATHRKVVFVVEGEKDADALISQGVIATTNPGGAGKWRDEYSYMLMGIRYAVLVWDNDEKDPKTGKYPGQEHALQVEASLKTVGVPVRLARAATGKDVHDHISAGYSVDQLVYERPGEPLVVPATNGHAKEEAGERGKPLPAVFQLALFKLREHAETRNLPPPRETDKGYEACCPAHDDTRPSLGIMVGNEQPLVVSCQRGCEVSEIAEALGIDIVEFGTKKVDHNVQTKKQLELIRAREEARVLWLGEQAPEVETPTVDPYTYMTAPLPDHPYTVEELHVTGSNTLVVSRYKVGKTILMQNLYRSLVNGEEFLGHFGVQPIEGRVAYLDYEMQEKQFKAWLQAGGPLDYDRMVAPWHLRGQSLHFWANGVRQQFVDWLKRHEITTLIVDTAARAWAGLVENENSNSEILRFTDTLDSVKIEAGVVDLFLVTHTGRESVFHPEGEERARGATRLEDWMDSGWYYTKDDKGARYLRAIGRGVDVDSFMVSYDPKTHLLATSGVSKKEHQIEAAIQHVVDMVAQFDGPPTMTELKDLMSGGDNSAKHRWILEAETRGLIEREKGKGRTLRAALTEAGIRMHERKIVLNGERG